MDVPWDGKPRGRVAGVTGIFSFALVVAAGLIAPLWDVPGSRASSAEIAHYVGAHRTAFLIALFLYACGVTLWLALFAAIRQRLMNATPGLATIFGSAGTAVVVVVLSGFVPMLTLAYRAPHVEDARLLYDVSFGLLAISGLPTALAMASYAVANRRGGRLERATAFVALIAAIAHVAIGASFFLRTGFLSLEGAGIVAIPATLFLWILLASLVELRDEISAETGEPSIRR